MTTPIVKQGSRIMHFRQSSLTDNPDSHEKIYQEIECTKCEVYKGQPQTDIQRKVATDRHRQPRTGTGSHGQAPAATDRHMLPQIDTGSHGQAPAATDRHRQPRTGTCCHR